jgi:hypothetical protein
LKIKQNQKKLFLIDLLEIFEIKKQQIKFFEIIKLFYLNFLEKKLKKDFLVENIIQKLEKLFYLVSILTQKQVIN